MSEPNFAENQRLRDAGLESLASCWRQGWEHRGYGWAQKPPVNAPLGSARRTAYNKGYNNVALGVSTAGLRAALAEYDATASVRDALCEQADSQVSADAWVASELLAITTVRRAFHALTAHINSWPHAKLADLKYMRDIAARETV